MMVAVYVAVQCGAVHSACVPSLAARWVHVSGLAQQPWREQPRVSSGAMQPVSPSHGPAHQTPNGDGHGGAGQVCACV